MKKRYVFPLCPGPDEGKRIGSLMRGYQNSKETFRHSNAAAMQENNPTNADESHLIIETPSWTLVHPPNNTLACPRSLQANPLSHNSLSTPATIDAVLLRPVPLIIRTAKPAATAGRRRT